MSRLIGFEAFRTTNGEGDNNDKNNGEDDNNNNNNNVASSIYAGNDEELKVQFRQLLTKTDGTTKLKSLDALIDLVENKKSPETLRESLNHFAFLFQRNFNDNNHIVRTRTVKLLLAFIGRIPKAVLEKKKNLFVVEILCLMHDPAVEVSNQFKSSLPWVQSFREQPLTDALLRKLLSFVRQNPSLGDDDLLNMHEARLSDAEIMEKNQRLRGEAICVLNSQLETKNNNQHQPSLTIHSLFVDNNTTTNWVIWKLLVSNETTSTVRQALYRLLTTVVTLRRFDLFYAASSSSYPDDAGWEKNKDVLKILYRLPSEKDRAITAPMLECLLLLGSAYPNFFFDASNASASVELCRKVLCPELYLLFARNCNDSGAKSFVCVFPLFCFLINQKIVTEVEFLDKLLGGWKEVNEVRIVSYDALLISVLECLYYLIKQQKNVEQVVIPRLILIITNILSFKNNYTVENKAQKQEIYKLLSKCVFDLPGEEFINQVLMTFSNGTSSSHTLFVFCFLVEYVAKDSFAAFVNKTFFSSQIGLEHLMGHWEAYSYLCLVLLRKKSIGFYSMGSETGLQLLEDWKQQNIASMGEEVFGLFVSFTLLKQQNLDTLFFVLDKIHNNNETALQLMQYVDILIRKMNEVKQELLTLLSDFELQQVRLKISSYVSLLLVSNEQAYTHWFTETAIKQRLDFVMGEMKTFLFGLDDDVFTNNPNLEIAKKLVAVLDCYEEDKWPPRCALYRAIYTFVLFPTKKNHDELLLKPVELVEFLRSVQYKKTHNKTIWARLALLTAASNARFTSMEEGGEISKYCDEIVLVVKHSSWEKAMELFCGVEPRCTLLDFVHRVISSPTFSLWSELRFTTTEASGESSMAVELMEYVLLHDPPPQSATLEKMLPHALNRAPSTKEREEIVTLLLVRGMEDLHCLKLAVPCVETYQLQSSKEFLIGVADASIGSIQQHVMDVSLVVGKPVEENAPSPDGGDKAQTKPVEFSVNDLVFYEKAGIPHRGKVIGKHFDEGKEFFYTIQYWKEGDAEETPGSEVQTVSSRLRARRLDEAKANANDPKDLEELNRMLQHARRRGDRQESLRLMKLQPSLLPKPVDTNAALEEKKRERMGATQKAWKEVEKIRKLQEEKNDLSGIRVGDGEAMQRREAATLVLRNVWGEEKLCLEVARLSALCGSDAIGEMDSFRRLCEDWLLDLIANVDVKALEEEGSVRSDENKVAVVTGLLNVVIQYVKATKSGGKNVGKIVGFAFSLNFWMEGVSIMAEMGEGGEDESIAGRLVGKFLDSVLGRDGGNEKNVEHLITRISWIVPKLKRFPSVLIHEVYDELVEKLETYSAAAVVEVKCALFSLLIRYPKMNPEPIPVITAENLGEEDASEELACKQGELLFPRGLMKSLKRCLGEGTVADLLRSDSNVVNVCLLWLLILKHIQAIYKSNAAHKELLASWLKFATVKTGENLFQKIMHVCSYCIETTSSTTHQEEDVLNDVLVFQQTIRDFSATTIHQLKQNLCAQTFFKNAFICSSFLRAWWMETLPRHEKEAIGKYCQKYVTPHVIDCDVRELEQIKKTGLWDPSEFFVTDLGSRTIAITSKKDESFIEMRIVFSELYPLMAPQVTCSSQAGVKEEKWRKWALQIVTLLSKREGSVFDAIRVWKENLDKEFEGKEPCPICMCVVHANDGSMPKVACTTCKNVFHGKCLGKWFSSSHNSACPLCKTSFLKNQAAA